MALFLDVMQDSRDCWKIIETIREEPQSRREWMLEYLANV
jgi:hypothetical protein